MGDPAHMAMARSSVGEWNAWRRDNLDIQPDLTRIDLSGRDLTGIDFRGVGLFKATLTDCVLRDAILRQARLIKTNLEGADLTGAFVYGVSAWDLNLRRATMHDLIITEPGQPVVTVDNLEVAQFIHLLLANEKIRDVIDTITSKVVLILGRFTPERKTILDEIKRLARQNDLLPVLFDFDGPANRNFTETVRTLAHLARMVIADLTEPASIPQELQAFVPDVRVPVAPIIAAGRHPWSMFADIQAYDWVLDVAEYEGGEDLAKKVFPHVLKSVSEWHESH